MFKTDAEAYLIPHVACSFEDISILIKFINVVSICFQHAFKAPGFCEILLRFKIFLLLSKICRSNARTCFHLVCHVLDHNPVSFQSAPCSTWNIIRQLFLQCSRSRKHKILLRIFSFLSTLCSLMFAVYRFV